MTTNAQFDRPLVRPLPPGHLQGRRDHLVREVQRQRSQKTDLFESRRARFAAIGALVAVVIGVATPAAGIGDRFLDAFGPDDLGPEIAADQVDELVTLETTWGTTAVLWEARTTDGGDCLFLDLRKPSDPRPLRQGIGGGICRQSGIDESQASPISARLNWLPAEHGNVGLVVSGQVASGDRIANIELQSATGSRQLPFRRGYFLGEVSSDAISRRLPSEAPSVLVAYDDSGNEVARLDLRQLLP